MPAAAAGEYISVSSQKEAEEVEEDEKEIPVCLKEHELDNLAGCFMKVRRAAGDRLA
jgi:hypothetical protein